MATYFLASTFPGGGRIDATFPPVNLISTSAAVVPGYHILSVNWELVVSVVLTRGGP